MAVTFEENLEKLENLVKSLEEGNTTLDQSLKAFEEGIKLSRMCRKKLADAEKKVEVLLKEEGTVVGREPLEI